MNGIGKGHQGGAPSFNNSTSLQKSVMGAGNRPAQRPWLVVAITGQESL